MAFCTNCGKENADGIKFCAHCGNAMQSVLAAPDSTDNKPPITDPWRLISLTVSLLPDRKMEISGYAQWLEADIQAMSGLEISSMLFRIRDARMKSKALEDKANECHKQAEELKKNYEMAKDKTNYGLVIGIPVGELILSLILRFCGRTLLSFLGVLGLVVAPILFIVMLAILIAGKRWNKKAIKAYEENYSAISEEVNQCVEAWYALYRDNNHLYVSAHMALPAYCDNIDALNYMIVCLQNHRASTLQEAINQYERHKQNEEVKQMMVAQIMASEAAVAASNRAAAAANNAAAAANRVAYDPYRGKP